MPHSLGAMFPFRMDGLLGDIEYWWHHATPNDFGMLAIMIVVSAWFVTKYYMD